MNMRNTVYILHDTGYTNMQAVCLPFSPIGFQNHHMIAVYMESHQSHTITLKTADTNASRSVAVITNRKQYGEVNSSLDCHIDSLEVYRGMKKVTEISHDGFSINENGSIEVIALLTTM